MLRLRVQLTLKVMCQDRKGRKNLNGKKFRLPLNNNLSDDDNPVILVTRNRSKDIQDNQLGNAA